MRILENTNIDFLGKRKMFYGISLGIILIGLALLFTKGIPLGIDFLGGTEVQLRFQNNIDVGEIRNIMDEAGYAGMEIKTLGNDREIMLRTPLQGEGQTVAEQIQQTLRAKITDNQFEVLSLNKVGPKIGSELRQDAIWATILSLIGILIYLSIRFQFMYAVGAVVAVFHDVLMTLSVLTILAFIFPGLNLELNQTMVAAFLTLIGFSVNDTVVIFDRIRENIKLFKNENILGVMNRSINATLSRTIITSGTVFLTILVLMIFGGEVLRSFAITFAVGIITGTYSTIFVAGAVVVDWRNKADESKIKSKAKLTPVKSR